MLRSQSTIQEFKQRIYERNHHVAKEKQILDVIMRQSMEQWEEERAARLQAAAEARRAAARRQRRLEQRRATVLAKQEAAARKAAEQVALQAANEDLTFSDTELGHLPDGSKDYLPNLVDDKDSLMQSQLGPSDARRAMSPPIGEALGNVYASAAMGRSRANAGTTFINKSFDV